MIDRLFGIKVRMSGLSINRYRPIIGRPIVDHRPADNRPLPLHRCISSLFALFWLYHQGWEEDGSSTGSSNGSSAFTTLSWRRDTPRSWTSGTPASFCQSFNGLWHQGRRYGPHIASCRLLDMVTRLWTTANTSAILPLAPAPTTWSRTGTGSWAVSWQWSGHHRDMLPS